MPTDKIKTQSPKRTELSQTARQDLDDIWNYVNRENSRAADKLIRDFLEKFKMLAENSGLGKVRDEIFINLHSFPFKKYIIFYFSIDDGIEVFRVIHSSRNIEQIFDDFFDDLK